MLGEEALPIIEIVPIGDDFYTYDAKYDAGRQPPHVPAPIDDDLTARMQMLALSVAPADRACATTRAPTSS